MEEIVENPKSKWMTFFVLPVLISVLMTLLHLLCYLFPIPMTIPEFGKLNPSAVSNENAEISEEELIDGELVKRSPASVTSFYFIDPIPVSVCFSIIVSFYYLKNETRKRLLISLLITNVLLFLFRSAVFHLYIYLHMGLGQFDLYQATELFLDRLGEIFRSL